MIECFLTCFGGSMLFGYFFKGIKRFFNLIFNILGLKNIENKTIIVLEDNGLRAFFWVTSLLINATLIQSIVFIDVEENNVVLIAFLILTIFYPLVFFALLYFGSLKIKNWG